MKKKLPRLSLNGKNGRKLTNGHVGKEAKNKLSNKWVDEEIESGSDDSDNDRNKDEDEADDEEDEEMSETADQKRKRLEWFFSHIYN